MDPVDAVLRIKCYRLRTVNNIHVSGQKKKKKSPISSMPAIIISICPTSFANNLAAPISFPTKTTLYEISAL